MTSTAPPVLRVSEAPWSTVSWSAIFAGAIVATTISLALLFLCAAAGFMMVSPWSGQGTDPSTFAISGAIAMIVVQWVSSAFGGFVTGRLRTRWESLHQDEVFFRDTLNGFLAWCVATLAVGVLVSSSATMVARTGIQATATVASGAAAGISLASAGSEPQGADPTAYFIDLLFRAPAGSPGPGQDAAPERLEATRIVVRSVVTGGISPSDKTYLAQIASARTGLNQDEAQRRVDDVLAQVQAAKVKAQEAADAARKAGALGSLFVFLSLLIGAFIAAAAAAIGASFRDNVPRVV
ncbi:hypothetical protein E8L99_04480 [Phreatobacter aquaticus]|uniref:PhnA-like protein n=2 Tax=Phreatobacter aquaticus TaxID=2570229 RepID=A0A4D7QMV9_9HYPH|nr:hypothetical protein E8L99_04480 [Phreatobacter aquaticus]